MRSVGDIIRDLDTRDLLHVADQMARKYHVTLEEMLGRGRRSPEAAARHELWHLLYEEIPSLTRIGEIFGRDHSTILAAVRKYEERFGRPSRVVVTDIDQPAKASCDSERAQCREPAGPAIKKCSAGTACVLTKSVAS